MSYEHFNRVLDVPQVKYDQLTGAAATVQYSDVWARDKFQKQLIFVQLANGVAAAPANFPTLFKVYGVEDSGDAANTRYEITAKDLTNYADWEGVMVLEVDETHYGQALGQNADNTPATLDYLQVALAAPNTIVYDVIAVMCDPYTKKRELVEELA